MTTDIFKNQNISIQEFPVDSGSRFGSDIMRAVKEFQVGSGDLSLIKVESGLVERHSGQLLLRLICMEYYMLLLRL